MMPNTILREAARCAGRRQVYTASKHALQRDAAFSSAGDIDEVLIKKTRVFFLQKEHLCTRLAEPRTHGPQSGRAGRASLIVHAQERGWTWPALNPEAAPQRMVTYPRPTPKNRCGACVHVIICRHQAEGRTAVGVLLHAKRTATGDARSERSSAKCCASARHTPRSFYS